MAGKKDKSDYDLLKYLSEVEKMDFGGVIAPELFTLDAAKLSKAEKEIFDGVAGIRPSSVSKAWPWRASPSYSDFDATTYTSTATTTTIDPSKLASSMSAKELERMVVEALAKGELKGDVPPKYQIDPEYTLNDIHPEVSRACKPENISSFSLKLHQQNAEFTLSAPAKLTVVKLDGKYSKQSFIGMERFVLEGVYPGKKSPIIVFKPVDRSGFKQMEVPINQAESVFGRAISDVLVSAAKSLNMPSQEESEYEEKAKVYEDFGSWS